MKIFNKKTFGGPFCSFAKANILYNLYKKYMFGGAVVFCFLFNYYMCYTCLSNMIFFGRAGIYRQ